MTPTPVGVLLLVATLACLILAWRSARAHTRNLNRAGRVFGVERWDGEPNYHYERRICDRIMGKDRSW